MHKARILHTNFHKYMVGESKRILANVYGLKQRGHHVILASPPESAIIQQAQNMGLLTFTEVQFYSGFRPLGFIKDVLALKRVIERDKINIVHTHGSKDSWSGAIAARLAAGDVKVVRTRHNHFPVKRHLFNKWLYQKLTQHLVAISEYIKAGFTCDNFVPEEKISLIYSAVDVAEYNPAQDGQIFRKELGISEDEQLVGMVAFVVPRKGHKYFLEAAAKILQTKRFKVKFVVVGDGDDALEADLQQMVKQAGYERQILFTGFRKDIKSVLARLDIFVLPTLEEALGLAFVEALAMKKPVIGAQVGGVPEIVRNNETGLLVPPKDAHSLGEAIASLLHNKKLACRLAEAGRRLVEAEFSTTALVEKSEQLYQKLLNPGS